MTLSKLIYNLFTFKTTNLYIYYFSTSALCKVSTNFIIVITVKFDVNQIVKYASIYLL